MKSKIIGIIGILLLLFGLASAFVFSYTPWYTFFVVGAALFLGWVNHFFSNNSFLDYRLSYIGKTYVVYLVVGILIEIAGLYVFDLWHYPVYNVPELVGHVLVFVYPAAFFFIHESLKLLRKILPSLALTAVVATPLHAFINELPNLSVDNWVYTIPYVDVEVLGINVVVVVGWIVLILVPLFTHRILLRK